MKKLIAVCLGLMLSASATAAEPAHPFLRGVNFPQAAFGDKILPGVNGVNYQWQTASDVDTFADLGSTILRVAFLWERIQPELNAPLNEDELGRLDRLVQAAAARQVTVILDVHNFGDYRGKMIGSADVPATAFADLWARLARHYADNPLIVYGLMNEPHAHDADAWAAIAQQAIDAIRATGARQMIFVPGTSYSGAHSWLSKKGALSNAEALNRIKDPAHNYVIEVHDYFDSDSSGTHTQCVSDHIGEERLAAFTQWLRDTGHKGFWGEFGASTEPTCVAALRNALDYVARNRDVWYGWTYWAAAPWFGTYMFNIYPPDPDRFPQVGVLKKAMHD